ncbi:proton-conducting transporter transmembrane domain-containing protein [Ehrlichia chaffeensis]|uniref:proton-conducting transporter transmembrane domain-containing protein n=1 Tax=Ehrlichia chaffeensis TaxID=945 RepID=UPI000444C73D|nr:proton-conducting transporter membrane subunit [Ehrlichia chaffeensis]AHX07993.1 NADH-Ubiquinone/plastoquinone (complex I), various chains family protein [Ehrlichia chaffeensis str. Osceola]
MTEYLANRFSIISFIPKLAFLVFVVLELLLYDTRTETYNYSLILFFVFSFIIVLIFLYIWNIKKHETILYLLYYLSSIAAISSGNLLSLVISFEFMALSALMIVAVNSFGANKNSVIHYSCIHFLSGVLLLIGASGGFLGIINGEYYYKLFFLIGLLINCACFPLSSWVTDAYSAALNNGILILSVFTTKVSAYVLLFFFQGEKILLFLGIATSVYGIIFSMLENNIKRLLCYNLVGQMGLVITAIGFSYNDGVDIYGIIVLQIVLSIVYQTLLFMVAISVINSTQKFNLSEIGGLFNKMPVEAVCSAIAIFTMGALPGTGGFVSKFLITHNINNVDLASVLMGKLFLICSILLFVSVGIKFFWYAFISKAIESPIVRKVCAASKLSMLILTLVCTFFGVFGSYYLFHDLDSEKLSSIVLQCGLIFGSILFFICFHPVFKGRVNFTMDIDWVYRVLFMSVILFINNFLLCIYNILITMLNNVLSTRILLYFKDGRKILGISSIDPLGFTIIFGMLFIIIMVVVYLCLSL